MLKLECVWNPPPSVLEIDGSEVHVWQANLNPPERQIQKLEHTLSSDEKLRAERFLFNRHRRRFIVSRGFLRTILGRYLNQAPDQLKFSYGPLGKPELTSNSRYGRLCFNLSHSNEIALYAIARGRSVGIDVEYIRLEADPGRLSERFFYPAEFAVISSLPPAEKQEEFFKSWTLKEAYLKATGEGLGGLDQVEVSLSPGEPPALQSIQGIPNMAIGWSSRQIKPSPGYTAALVVEGQGWRLSQYKIP